MLRKVKVIGLGGIGSYLVEPLARYLSYTGDQIEILCVDGDAYEEKNRARQQFECFENKAVVTISCLRTKFPKIHFRAKNEYLTKNNAISTIRDGDVVFLCVDNHATRKIVSDRCQELDNVVLISGGNDYTDGNVIYFLRKDGRNVTKSPTQLFKSIAEPTDQHPEEIKDRVGCEQEALANPQLLFTNLTAASIMLNVYYAHEHGKANFEQVYFDILTQRMRPKPEPVINLGE